MTRGRARRLAGLELLLKKISWLSSKQLKVLEPKLVKFKIWPL
jgi:hypothetical protein